MKMSKSIHDYKEAMDNIKISESFYKRTEVLLTEIPEVKIEKRSVISGRRISAVIMSAAACVICLFGVKLAIDGRQADIATETVTETGGAEGDITNTDSSATKEADELIDEFGEYDDAGIVAESITSDSLDGEHEQDSDVGIAPASANPTASTESEEAKTTAAVSETTVTTTASQTTTASDKRVVQGLEPHIAPSADTPSETNDAEGDEEPALEMPNPGASGSVGADGGDVVDTDIMEDAEDVGNDEAAPAAVPAKTETEPLFSELSLDNITADITPYFSMGNIKSGEGTVKKSGTEFKPILDLIAGMDSSATKIGNGSFTSLFSIRIYDENIDLEFYSIYLTNHESIVITKHSPDGSQVRETYALRREYYESIKHTLFLLFGAEGDYELFTNLIGGK